MSSKEIFWIIKSMVFALTLVKMAKDMKDNGLEAWNRVMESIIGQMGKDIKGSTNSIIGKAKGLCIIVRNKNIQVVGRMGISTDKEFIRHNTKEWMGYGLKEIYPK